MEPNTFLYNDGTLYCFHIPQYSGKGSFTGVYPDLKSLIGAMNDYRTFFDTTFMPEGGVPDTPYTKRYASRFRPLDPEQVEEVIEALKG